MTLSAARKVKLHSYLIHRTTGKKMRVHSAFCGDPRHENHPCPSHCRACIAERCKGVTFVILTKGDKRSYSHRAFLEPSKPNLKHSYKPVFP